MSFYKNSDINDDKNICLGLARSVAPFKGGNSKYNAMSAFLTIDGFCIRYSLAIAFYIYFQEEGTIKSTKNRGYIGNITVPLCAEYLYSKYATENIKDIKRFKWQATQGNSDPLYSQSLSALEKNRMISLREQSRYESTLANMETYGHISNEYNWQSSVNAEVPEKFQRR